jgi:putative ATP-grasp target RiPP
VRKVTSGNVRTKIANISAIGFELAEAKLSLVSGGLARRCSERSASVSSPGDPDNQMDDVED